MDEHQHQTSSSDVRVVGSEKTVMSNMWWFIITFSTVLVLWITEKFRQLVSPKTVRKNQHSESASTEVKSTINGSFKIPHSVEDGSTIKSKEVLNGKPRVTGFEERQITSADSQEILQLNSNIQSSVTEICPVNESLKNYEAEPNEINLARNELSVNNGRQHVSNAKLLEIGGRKNEDVVDSGGEYNDDTDTETITSENTEDLSSSSSTKEETELEAGAEIVEQSASPISESKDLLDQVTRPVANEQSETAEKMDLFDDNLPELATQISVGEVHESIDIMTTLSETEKELEEDDDDDDDDDEGGMSYVLRINTGDEHSDNVIHSTNWERAIGESEDSMTDEECGTVYRAKGFDVNTDEMQTKAEEMQQQQETEATANVEETVTLDSESLQEIEAERRRIIANQVVRGKRIDTWLLSENDNVNSMPEIVTTIPKKETSPEPSETEAFLAIPVMLECPSTAEESDDSLNTFHETPIPKPEPDSKGETNDRTEFSEEEHLMAMTSVANQPPSLDASDYNHDPDSLDLIPENENFQNVQMNNNLQLHEDQNDRNYHIDCNGVPKSNVAIENSDMVGDMFLDHGDIKNKVNGINGSLSTAPWQETHGTFMRETIIDREVRLALEREEEFRKELLRKGVVIEPEPKISNVHQQEKLNNGSHSPDQSAYFKTKVLSEIRSRDVNTVLSMENGTRNIGNAVEDMVLVGNRDPTNPLESVIQREIRQQKEREESLAQERQMAQMAAQMKTQLAHKSLRENGFCSGSTITKGSIKEIYHHQRYPQTILNCDIQDQHNGKLHNRDEESWSQRQKFNASDSGIESPLNSDPCLLELGSGSSDGENSDGLLPVFHHQRAESLDSLGSAGTPSSNSSTSAEPPLPRRQVKVKPLVDEEVDTRPTYQVLKESPIEREIRLAREREEALRREKGLPVPPPSSPPPITSISEPSALLSNSKKQAASAAAASWVRSRAMDLNNLKEQRSVQWRLATSRIQQEIEEHTQRELALRAAGSIRTTSEDHVDSKITRLSEVFVENPCSPSKFSLSPPSTPDSEHTDSSGSNTSSPANHVSAHGSYGKTNTLPIQNNHSGRLFTKAGGCGTLNGSASIQSTLPRRPLSGAGKGVMQKFIASRGKVIPSFGSPKSISTSNLSMYAHCDGESSREQLMKEIRTPPPRNAKRTYCSAETKIQNELQQMKMREEELRLVRAKSFAMSQPNLLSIVDDDDDDILDSPLTNRGNPLLREKCSSNPNLLEDCSDMENQVTHTKPAVCRKRSALIAQWEEKIQQNSDY